MRLARHCGWRPEHPLILANLAATTLACGDPHRASLLLDRAAALAPDNARLQSVRLRTLNYREDLSGRDIGELHLQGAAVYARLAGPRMAHRTIDSDPSRRLRIGYVSADFYTHSVAFFFEPILANHDREHFEIVCYSNSFVGDRTTHRLRAMRNEWVQIQAASDDAVARRIQQDRIDILVDLSGHTQRHRLAVFAQKPAPIAVSYLGYSNTTGLESIDYRLTDARADPPGDATGPHTETLVRLPVGFSCYRAPDDAPEVSALPSAQRGFVTFGSLGELSKLSAGIVDAWTRILNQIPDARLVLQASALNHPSMKAALRQRFARAGLDAGRLELLGSAGLAEHLSNYRSIDIALDTFPWNGHTTLSHALWMGVPVISLSGDRHASRMGESVLTMLGLGELVARSPAEYVSKAVALSHRGDLLAVLRASMRERMRRSAFMQHERLTREIESAYRLMWRGWCARAKSS